MVQSLEQYVAQATQAYQPTQTAIQNQINALSGQLATTNEQINKNYAQQQAGLNRQRNMAAETASMQAAGSGGSFGGAANIANRKYYDQTFVPAVTQLRSSQANELAGARQASEDQRRSYESQLADLSTRGQQQSLAQYYNDLNAEKEREFQAAQAEANRALQRQQIAAQNAYNKYLMDAMKSNRNTRPSWDFGNGYTLTVADNGQAVYYRGSTPVSAGQFLEGTGARGANWDLWNDVWNNGVSTKGVGSDTVEAFNRRSPSGNYGYLF